MFTLAIEYLTGRTVATAFSDRDAAEWPPHPARLFFALVSAWAEDVMDGVEREALEWLEQQGPPSLHASGADVRHAMTTYVPVNDPRPGSEGVLPDRRSRQPRTFPSLTPLSSRVHMIWPAAEPDPRLRSVLEHLVGRVSYLGHSSSLVSIRVAEEAPEPTYVPVDNGGDLVLRVLVSGHLAALAHAHSVFRDSGIRGQLPCAFQAYAARSETESDGPPTGGVFEELVVFRRKDGPRLAVEAAELVASTLRRATISACDEPVPELMSGHRADGSKSDRPHVAFVALPDAGHAHADGRLLGVAAVLPRALSSEERRLALAALSRVARLTMGRAGAWELGHATLDAPQRGLLPQTWTRPSRRWATVTPIELDAFPDQPYGEEAVQIVAECCVRTALPRPAKVVVRPDSVVSGIPPWHEFARSRQATRRPRRPLVHADIVFDDRVQGPVLLGAGRYQGLGLCRPLDRLQR